MYPEALLRRVNKPGRYLGCEVGAVIKPRENVRLRWALAFPDLYEIGMSWQGLKILYSVLNDDERFAAERVFMPAADAVEILRELGEPLPALESGDPVRDFDVFGITLPYELSYTTVLAMLELAGIPLLASERVANDPLVIGGGVCAFNPEPVADFFDALLLGDGEFAITEISELLMHAKQEGLPRAEALLSLKDVTGVYIPSLYEPAYDGPVLTAVNPKADAPEAVAKAIVADLNDAPYPVEQIVPFTEAVQDRVTVEIARGCTQGCRFCQAGMTYRPTRERTPAAVVDIATRALRNAGHDELSLLSLSTGDYTALDNLLEPLMDFAEETGAVLGLPSLRIGTISPAAMAQVARGKKGSFTFAPEAGSARLRRVINKTITDEEIERTARDLFAAGWQKLKLYFMCGLPTETDEDIDDIVDVVGRIIAIGKEMKVNGLTVTPSVSTFVPKACTPFQWDAMIGPERVYEIHERLAQGFRSLGLNWRRHGVGMSELEGIFARGDRRLSDLILDAFKAGAKLDGWSEHFQPAAWESARAAFAERHGFEPATYARRERGEGETLPWDHLSDRVGKGYYLKERHAAFAEEPVTDCLVNKCTKCDVCDFTQVLPRPVIRKGKAKMPADVPAMVAAKPAGAEARLRLKYSRSGAAIFLSHRETMDAMVRALRRAGLRIKYSQGFTPHPKVSFGPALPTGAASDTEYADAVVLGTPPLTALTTRLADALPPGFTLLGLWSVPDDLAALDAAINEIEYELDLSGLDIAADIASAVAKFLEADEYLIRKAGKPRNKSRPGRSYKPVKVKTVDIRARVNSLTWDDKRRTLTARVTHGASGSVKPVLLATELTGTDMETVRNVPLRRTAVTFTPPALPDDVGEDK